MTADNQEAHLDSTLYHLSYLGVIELIGEDADQFLQGQLTCNVMELNDSKASLAAFCNPKGRVISTLLLIKKQSGFLVILPRSLVDKVLKKLQMYVLRSKVKLADKSDELKVIGLSGSGLLAQSDFPDIDFHCNTNAGWSYIKLPSTHQRFLGIIESNEDSYQGLESFVVGDECEWRYQEISSGFPWFDIEQSEKYIPQMLNIDGLGGVSFNKGCYTGQEVVARTHYLGKAKRQLVLGECRRISQSNSNMTVKNAETKENIGEILALQSNENSTRMLLVLQTVDDNTKNLILDDAEQTPLTLIPYQ